MEELHLQELFDSEGYLIDLDRWSPELMHALAKSDNFELTPAHIQVIETVREFYALYQLSPAMRPLVKAMRQKHGDEKGKSIYLMKLFSESPPKQAARYAGLPKPLNCL